MASEAGIAGGDLQRDHAPARSAAAAGGETVGTRFAAQRRAEPSSFKLWLKYAKPPAGGVLVDAGAARVCARAAPACCRSAIVAVEGNFDAGDAVEVAVDGGGRSARASANTPRGELAR